MTADITALGKFDPAVFDLPLQAAERVLNLEQVRWMVGKMVKITAKGDVYGRKWTAEEYADILDAVLTREYDKQLIYVAIKSGAVSVRAISACIGLGLRRISHLLADMEKTAMVEFKGMDAKKPVFAAI